MLLVQGRSVVVDVGSLGFHDCGIGLTDNGDQEVHEYHEKDNDIEEEKDEPSKGHHTKRKNILPLVHFSTIFQGLFFFILDEGCPDRVGWNS